MFYMGQRVFRSERLKVYSPFDGSLIDDISLTIKDDVDAIMATAARGAAIMRKVHAGRRAEILEKAADALLRELEPMARLLSQEVGKTIREARAEVGRAINTLRVSATAARTLRGQTVPFDLSDATSKVGYYARVPVGIVLAITPFNFPLNLACHKIAPAFAAGNAVIIKPASKTPLTTMRLAEILVQAGLPMEAIAVVAAPGGELTDMLLKRQEIRKVTFTGSTAVGEHIMRTAGLKKVTMELGSNACVVVMEDADLPAVAKKIRAGGCACAGQVCISIQRVFAQHGVIDRLLELLKEEFATVTGGDPLDEATGMGVMVSEAAGKGAKAMVDSTVAAGGALVVGGRLSGAYMEPTIVRNAPRASDLMQKEVFAPVIAVNGFEGVKDAIAMVNDSPYGLQASIFTNDLSAALQFIDGADCGSVLVNEAPNFRVDNMPYGGMKQSGVGREGPEFAIEEMTELKLVIFDFPQKS